VTRVTQLGGDLEERHHYTCIDQVDWSTAVMCSIAILDHVATIVGLKRSAGSGSAITFASVFHTGVGVSSVVAGVHAFLGSGVSVHVLAEGERTCSCIITTIE
jgi:hypothetical protein